MAGGDWASEEPAVDGRGILVEVPRTLVAAAHDQCAVLAYTGHDNCSPASEARDGKVFVGSGAGAYHPAFYWVVGTASAWLEGANRLYAMRIVAALLCALFYGAAAWCATRMKSRWPLAGVFIATTPVLIYSTGIVAPNGLEMCAAMALWTSLLTLSTDARDQPSYGTRVLWVAIISAMVLSTLRLLGPLFVLAIVMTVMSFEWKGFWRVVKRNLTTVTVGAVLVAASAGNLLWWVAGPGSVLGTDDPEPSNLGPLYLLLWTLQSIAAFPYRNQMGSLLTYPVVGALAAVLVIFAARTAPWRRGLVMFLALAGALALPFLATLATSSDVGIIWQGRYGLPYAVGFLILAGYAVADQLTQRALGWRLAVPSVLAVSFAVAACMIKIRHGEITDNLASLNDATWHPPFVTTLVVLTLASGAATSLALARRSP